jgi:hypothetical protein
VISLNKENSHFGDLMKINYGFIAFPWEKADIYYFGLIRFACD